MKKLSSVLLLLAVICLGSVIVKAQTPRLQLFEYFDNSNIPPYIAVRNQYYDSLANVNAGKIVTIKYHVNWPGTDPMNQHNPTQPQARVTYYGINADPWGVHEGGDSTQGLYFGSGISTSFTQNNIDARAAVASPFAISVSHSLNSARDSIRCHAVITKTDTATGTLAAHVVVIEKMMHFNTAPGQSGDTYFADVMKQMLPTYQGSTLPVMNIGDSTELNLSWKLTNVFDTTQLAVICFVQDRATHAVHQAGYSAPHPQVNNAGVTLVANAANFGCDSVSCEFALYNAGVNTLDSCTINYQLNDGTPSSFPWAGNLATGASTNITSPSFYAVGYNRLNIFITNPNGSPDPSSFNDTIVTVFGNPSVPASAPVTEGFENTFVPADWSVGNPDNGKTWEQATAGGFGNSLKSAKINWYYIPQGRDDLYAPALDLSAADSAHLEFSVAYARYSASNYDTLQVRVSINCGTSWTVVYQKGYTNLATAPDTVNPFVPTASQWRHETVDLSPYNGQANVLVQFHAISGYGNDLYLDDINISITNTTGIALADVATHTEVVPNPFTNELMIKTTGSEPSEVVIYDVALKKLIQQSFMHVVSLNTDRLAKGVYLYEVKSKNGVMKTGKVVKE